MAGCCLVHHTSLSSSTVWCYFIDCITHFLIKFSEETTSHLGLHPAAPAVNTWVFVGLACKGLWEGTQIKEETGSLSYNGSVNENENKYVGSVEETLSPGHFAVGKKLEVGDSSLDSVCVKFTLLFISSLQIGRAPTSSVAPEKSDLHANCSRLG